jgi:ribosomal protein L6P/L9E
MSRIGKLPVEFAADIKVSANGNVITSRSKTGSRQGNLTGPRFSSVHWFFGQSHGAAKPPDF